MKSFFSFLLNSVISLRPINLFLISITQTLTSVFLLHKPLCISNIFTSADNNTNAFWCPNLYSLILATVLSAAAGYILNNIMDRKIDLINYPNRGSFTEKNLSFLYFLNSIFFVIALLLGFFISLPIGSSILGSIILLVLYAKYSKKIGVLKPILVSFLTSFSVILVGLLEYTSIPPTIWLFSIWAFLISMIREISKDLEDLEGDTSQNSFTSVIHLGKAKSRIVLYSLSIFLILSITISVFISAITFPNLIHKTLMILLTGIFIYFVYRIERKNSNFVDYKNYKNLSFFCKLIMLVGILGMSVY